MYLIKTYNNSKSSFKRSFYCIIAILTYTNFSYAQKLNEKGTLKKARKFLAIEKYTKSQEEYLKLTEAFPENETYNFEAGLSYFYSSYDRQKSIPYFEAAVENIKKDTVGEMYFYLAKSYQLIHDFEKSNELFKKFESFIIKHSKHGKKVEQSMIEEVNYNNYGVTHKQSKKTDLHIKNLGESINTADREYAPVWFKSGNIILFTSRRKTKGNNKLDKFDLLPFEDIYVAKKQNNWSIIEHTEEEVLKYIPKNINTDKHDAAISYNGNFNELYTYKDDAIWKSVFEDGKWSPLKKMDKTVNTSISNIPSITLSPNGDQLFFVATKISGIGNKDIYQSRKMENGKWESPTLLSTNINTEYDEDAPYLSQDGKTLFFSSTGHSSMGGYDIFKSEWVNGEWSQAENMGFPFNSSQDDIYYVADSTNQNGFFSSNRDEGYGSFDIYSFFYECENIENSTIEGIIYASESNKPLSGKIQLLGDYGTEISSSNADENGRFSLLAAPEKNYQIVITPDGYEPRNYNFNLPKQCEEYSLFTAIDINIIDRDDEKLQATTIKNFFFDVTTELEVFKQTEDITNLTKQDFLSAKEKELIAFGNSISTEDSLNYIVINDTIEIDEAKITKPLSPLAKFDNVLFAFDKSNLTSNAKETIKKVAEYLNSSEGAKYYVTVTGYTDAKRDYELSKRIFKSKNLSYTKNAAEARSKEYNVLLSNKRAKSVQRYLISLGVSKNRIILNSLGEENPVVPNINSDGTDNPENRSLNRRVSFELSNPKLL